MEQQADSTTIPISFAPAVRSHAITPSSNNEVADSVDHGDTIIIVCGLAAPNNTEGPFSALRKRRTFWTACASCIKKSKHSIEYIDCDISCPQCNTTFKATEVSRPRKQPTTTAENVHSSAIVTSPGTMVEPSKLKPTVETPPAKRVKRDINATQAAGNHGGNLKGINAITMVEPSKLKTTVETPLSKRVKRDINATQAAGKHGGSLKGINAITMVEPSKLKPTVETPLPKRVKRDINATQAAGKHAGNLKGINAITKDEINRLLKSKGWNMVMEEGINGNNVGQ